jgi:hypothetical protein
MVWLEYTTGFIVYAFREKRKDVLAAHRKIDYHRLIRRNVNMIHYAVVAVFYFFPGVQIRLDFSYDLVYIIAIATARYAKRKNAKILIIRRRRNSYLRYAVIIYRI